MEKLIYQIVVKKTTTNEISVYNFEYKDGFETILKSLKKDPKKIIITTNIAYK